MKPGCAQFLLIMLLRRAQKVSRYTQYYAHNYCIYATAHVQVYSFNGYINIVKLHPVMHYNMPCCSALFDLHIILNIMVMRKFMPHSVPS